MDPTSAVILLALLTFVMMILRKLVKMPPPLGWFLGGLIGLSYWVILLTTTHSIAPPPAWGPVALFGLLLVSPFCFCIGAYLSLEEAEPRGNVPRWANVVGLGVSAGLFFVFLTSFLSFVVFAG